MRAQVSFTPTESKKLIAKALIRIDEVKKALNEGMLVMHPSSSTYFLVEEIIGREPGTDAWLCGCIVPKGPCAELGTTRMFPRRQKISPATFPASWVIRNGKLETGIALGSLVEQMGPNDVSVKGVNALDIHGNVGILAANLEEGGTYQVVYAALRQKGFKVIFPVGLEKLIPIPIKEATKEALRLQTDYSMGLPCGLIPIDYGIVVTEVDAIKILSGATAVPISAGGLGGAEGAITLVMKGETEQVSEAIKYSEEVKGATLPEIRLRSCAECEDLRCSLVGGKKHWITI